MKKYRVLCLTDHIKHSKENSIYSIISSMSDHPRCEEVVVASRSSDLNLSFFRDHEFDFICGSKASNDFNFEDARKDLLQGQVRYRTSDFDILFLRLPRPVSDEFLIDLGKHFHSKCIINAPSGIIDCSSKAVLMNFKDVCPPIKLCNSIEDILSFAEKYELVLKPLKEYGGKGLLRINKDKLNDGFNDHDTKDYLKSVEPFIQNEGYLAMKYLKNVDKGDKRLIVVNGEILAASLRLPAEGSWLCNVAVGGKAVPAEPDEREKEIVSFIDPYLSAKGILIYGVDTLVDDSGQRILSEINALSIGGFPQAEMQTGRPVIRITLDKIFKYADIQLNE